MPLSTSKVLHRINALNKYGLVHYKNTAMDYLPPGVLAQNKSKPNFRLFFPHNGKFWDPQ